MNNELLPDNLQKLIDDINSSPSGYEAAQKLIEAAEKGLIEMKNGVLFKSGEYVIQNLFRCYGEKYEENIRLLNSMQLSIVPEHITTIIKDDDIFIFTKIKGCKDGDLKPYYKARSDVSLEDKNSALDDLKKLTENGYTDDKIFSSPDLWYVSPGNNKIVIPSFEALRKVVPGEEEEIIDSYKRILFEL